MNARKIVGIGVPVILLITCLILARAWSDANQNFDSYVEFHHHHNSEFDDLQMQLRELNDTLNLKKSTVWVDNQTISQSASDYTSWTFSPSYAGYLEIWLSSATTSNTYVEVLVPSGYGVPPIRINLTAEHEENFPVLPFAPVEIRVGNTNTVGNATETVTVTYHY
jgi:hypothetical protein